MNHSATKSNDAPRTMSIKNLLTHTPQKVVPARPTDVGMAVNSAATKKVMPSEPKKEAERGAAVPSCAVKSAPTSSVVSKLHPVTGTVSNRRVLPQSEQLSARKLRRIKRRLFLEAVGG